mmetsp:Transcript_18008/g.37744  ORF Transcript_18008/g.37744 Transcript_18008/m.37744 type:complete len:80 (-) Transcript_18008:280-519(-)
MEGCLSVFILYVNSNRAHFRENLNGGNVGSCPGGNVESSTPETVNRVGRFPVQLNDQLYDMCWRIKADTGMKKCHAVEF